ncbi:MAG: hypothetical protein FJX76_20490 [Armatimonadetes bacterium]|nr:hypothetical protein [Armatimonadota bacterium]
MKITPWILGALIIAAAVPGDAQTPDNTRQMRRNPFVLATPRNPEPPVKRLSPVGNQKDVKVTTLTQVKAQRPSAASLLAGVSVVGILEGTETVALLQEGESFDTVRPGDEVRGFRVTGVGRGRVSLMRDGEVFSLRLHTADGAPANVVSPP